MLHTLHVWQLHDMCSARNFHDQLLGLMDPVGEAFCLFDSLKYLFVMLKRGEGGGGGRRSTIYRDEGKRDLQAQHSLHHAPRRSCG